MIIHNKSAERDSGVGPWRLVFRQARDVIASPQEALLRALDATSPFSWRRFATLLVISIAIGSALFMWINPLSNRTLAQPADRAVLVVSLTFAGAMLMFLILVAASIALRQVLRFLGRHATFPSLFRMLLCASLPGAIGTMVEPIAMRLHHETISFTQSSVSVPITVFGVWSVALFTYGLWLMWISPQDGPA